MPDTDRLQLSRQHLTLFIRRPDPVQLGIILHKEGEILKRHIVFRPPAYLALFLCCVLSAREGVFVDLVFDLIGCVGEEDG